MRDQARTPIPFAPPTCACWPSRSSPIRARCATRTCCRRSSTCPGPSDFPAGSLALPWDAERGLRGRTAGAEARRGERRAAGVLGQILALALRRGPHRAAAAVPRARGRARRSRRWRPAARYLEHLRDAWDPQDAGRALRRAAGAGDRAGFVRRGGARADAARPPSRPATANVTLLEEPQAAFYAWIERHPDWRERVQAGRSDPGGRYRRRHHGFHADRGHRAATANWRSSASRWASTSCWAATISTWRWPAWSPRGWRRRARASTACSSRRCGTTAASPRRSCSSPVPRSQRAAGHDSRQRHRPGGRHHQGRRCSRDDIDRMLGEGFLPAVASTEMPARQRRVGLQEIGLPYAADAAITGTWRASCASRRPPPSTARCAAVPSGLACPTHVLFNGGVLNAALVRERILERSEFAGSPRRAWPPVQPLTRRRPDARRLARRGLLRPGAARAAACASAAACRAPTTSASRAPCPPSPASPRRSRRSRWCRSAWRKARTSRIPGREFGLVVGEPAEFRFFYFGRRARTTSPAT